MSGVSEVQKSACGKEEGLEVRGVQGSGKRCISSCFAQEKGAFVIPSCSSSFQRLSFLNFSSFC